MWPCGWRASHQIPAITASSAGVAEAVARTKASANADFCGTRIASSRGSVNRAAFAPHTSCRGRDWLSSSAAGIPRMAGARPGCNRAPTILVPAGSRTRNGSVQGPTTRGGSSLMKTMSMQASGRTRWAYSPEPIITCFQMQKKKFPRDAGTGNSRYCEKAGLRCSSGLVTSLRYS
jgi:hypothetical protein